MSDTKSPFAAVSTDNLHAAVMDAVALMGKVILTDEPLLRASHVLRSALVQYADSQLAAPVAPATVAVPDEPTFNMQNGPRITWSLASGIYALYAKLYGRDQSLQRLHERAGFGWAEVEFIWKESGKRFGIRATVDAFDAAYRAAASQQKENT